MRFLVTNNHLNSIGGTETWVYTFVKTARKYGHEVDVYTPNPGFVLDKMVEDFGVGTTLQDTYDGCFCNHTSTIPTAKGRGKVIQTCHGKFPFVEQPHKDADQYVAISQEIREHILLLTGQFDTPIIYNMIDLERFKCVIPTHVKPFRVLSLSQSKTFNDQLNDVCGKRGLALFVQNKFENPRWDIENVMNKVDFVVTLGRGAYESISCGRQVLIADERDYQGVLGDGPLTVDNIDKLIVNNCSGRATSRRHTVEIFVEKFLYQYDVSKGYDLARWSIDNLDADKQFEKYLKLL